MRRVLAITVIAALICSTGLPVWAQICATGQKTPMCHRMQASQQAAQKAMPAHHCDSMAMEDEQDATVPSGSEAIIKGGSSECPMQCCTQANAGTNSAVPATGLKAVLLSSADHVDVPAVTFTTPGFSSHTDRGPPVA